VTAGLKAPSDTADSGLDEDPEVDVTFAGAGQPAGGGTNGARVVATERWCGQIGGGNPWSENPGHGSAAKYMRKARGGANRRERAKRWGRNGEGHGMPDTQWTPRVDVAKRGETQGRSTGHRRKVEHSGG
jgi:hypothetical protein